MAKLVCYLFSTKNWENVYSKIQFFSIFSYFADNIANTFLISLSFCAQHLTTHKSVIIYKPLIQCSFTVQFFSLSKGQE